MALIERTAYPRFGLDPSTEELARLYTPTLRELDLSRRATRGGETQQLAFLVMLKGFQRLGYFPKPEEVPEAVVAHLRSRLGLGEVSEAPPRPRQRYRDAIRGHLGVEAFGDEAKRVAAEAISDAALTMDDPADLVNVAIEELVKERYELPAFSTLDRLARKVRHAANSALFAGVDGMLTGAGPSLRPEVRLLTGTPSGGERHLKECREEMEGAMRRLEIMVDRGGKVQVQAGRLVFSRDDHEGPPESAKALGREVSKRLPKVELTDLVVEVDSWTHFLSRLTHAGGSEPRTADLRRHLHAAILAQATNIGPVRMADLADLSYEKLAWA